MTDFTAQRRRLAERLASAEAARQSLEADLASASYADLDDGGSRAAKIAERLAAADAQLRGLHAASGEIDKAEAVEQAKAAEAERVARQKTLDAKLAALQKWTSSLAKALGAFTDALADAKAAEVAAWAAADGLDMTLDQQSIERLVPIALVELGATLPRALAVDELFAAKHPGLNCPPAVELLKQRREVAPICRVG